MRKAECIKVKYDFFFLNLWRISLFSDSADILIYVGNCIRGFPRK